MLGGKNEAHLVAKEERMFLSFPFILVYTMPPSGH